jgi:glycosyltransferase involved in cell wall biosynthesis
VRILALSNLYPPYSIDGYEEGCRQVLEGLAARGHRVCVLTSTYGTKGPADEQQGEIKVSRRLHFHWLRERSWRNLWELAKIEKEGLAAFHHLLREFRPEVLSLWNMGGLSESLITAAQESKVPAVFHVSDEWPRRLGGDPWLHFWCRRPRQALKRPVKAAAVGLMRQMCGRRLCFRMPDKRFSACQFASDFLRETLTAEGLETDRAEVIRWGARASSLRTLPSSGRNGTAVSLLYLGQLAPHKGIERVLEALSLLRDKMDYRDISLTLAGTAPQPEYLFSLRELVEEKHLSGLVKFLPARPKKRIIEFCQQYDILVFPPAWEEPSSVVLLEAMAAGLAVVAAAAGSTSEVIRDRQNGLLCRPDDAQELAERIEALVWNKSLRRSLAEGAQETVRREFDINHMIERVEELLLREGGAYAAGD